MGEYQPHLGRIISELRSESALSVESAAEKAKIDQRTYRKIEAGKFAQESKIGAVCEIYGGVAEVKRRILEKQGREGAAPAISRNLPSHEISLSQIGKHLDEIDNKVHRDFRLLMSPTRGSAPTAFSSRKLISSLSALGIPLEIVLILLDELPSELLDLVERKTEQLSTNHIRSAVMRLIARLTPSQIMATEMFRLRAEISREDGQASPVSPDQIKFDWSSRYARRFGAASQAIQVIERDGSITSLDYAFLKNVLLPHALRRLLGKDFSLENNSIINSTIISEMAQSALDEFKRLGLYTIRYKTVMRLSEDIAMQPPHPWVVVDETRDATIDYDLKRARANVSRLIDPAENSKIDLEYRYAEALRHACSAILGTYGGYLGNRDTSPIHLLKHWLTLEEQNSVLWQSCQLRMIDSDLQAIGIPKEELKNKLKRMELPPRGSPDALAERCNEFIELAEKLRVQRARMEDAAKTLVSMPDPPRTTAFAIIYETIMSCFGCRKLKILKDKTREVDLGYMGTIRTDDSVLARHAPSTLFLYCADPLDEAQVNDVVAHALDQLAAHQMSRSALILCLGDPGTLLDRKMKVARKALKRDELLSAASIFDLREQRSRSVPVEDIIDNIFA